MKNYFKKFSIMFILLLTIMGIGAIQNGTVTNAATVGQQLTSPEAGWIRYDDTYAGISYEGNFGNSRIPSLYNGEERVSSHNGDKIKFYAYCDKIRIIASKCDNRYNTNHMEVFVDGKSAGKINMYYSSLLPQTLLFNYNFSNLAVHYIEIKNISTDGRYALLDAIDINKGGQILPYKQSIILNKSLINLTKGDSEKLIATTTPSGVAVQWKSSDESVAIVDENGNVIAVKEGTCTITATTANGSNLSASCTVSISKKNEEIDIDKPSIDLNIDNTNQLTATTTPAGAEVVWSSSDTSVATVDSTGKVTAVGGGTCTITATINDGSNISDTCNVNVTKKAEQESIVLNKSTTDLIEGDSEVLIATTTPVAVGVTWTSSDTSIATVDSTGKVTGIKEGTATITATTTDGSNLSATCAVTVTGKGTEPTNPDTDPTDLDKIVNIAHAKGDNTNNAGGDVTIIFHGAADTTLSVVKTADVKEVWVGDNFTYTIVVTNTSTKTAKAVIVNDPAPNHIDFSVNGVTSTQGKIDPSSTSKNIIVNVGDIPPLGTVTIKIPATVVL